MFSRISTVALAIVVVALGVTTFAFSKRSQETTAELEHTQAELQRLKSKHSAARSDDSLRELLNQQEEANAELRDELTKLKGGHPADAAKPVARAAGSDSSRGGNRPGGGGAWMDRLKQEDPERYKQMVEQREQRRQATDKWFQDKISALDERAQTAPTKEEAEVASQIADTLAKLNDLRSQWAAIRDLPDDQRREASQQLQADTRDTYQALSTLRDQDRQNQLAGLARSMGLTDPQPFVENVTGIYKNTEYNPGGGPGGPGGPGGFGGRGGGGGDRGNQSPQAQQPPSPGK